MILSLFLFKPNCSTKAVELFNRAKGRILQQDNNNNDTLDNYDLGQEQVVELYNQYLVDGLAFKASADGGNKEDYGKAIESFRKQLI